MALSTLRIHEGEEIGRAERKRDAILLLMLTVKDPCAPHLIDIEHIMGYVFRNVHLDSVSVADPLKRDFCPFCYTCDGCFVASFPC